MNEKETKEIRSRMRNDRCAATRIYGSYVNSEGNVIATIDEAIGMLTNEEVEHYFGLIRKAYSGKVGRDFLELNLTNEQEAGEPYKTLLSLVQDNMKDDTLRERLFNSIVSGIQMEGNYVILAVEDIYDVPGRNADGEQSFESGNVFRYITCVVCPVKQGKYELGYVDEEKKFHGASIHQLIDLPVLGFMFPSFNERSADIHQAMIYSKKEQPNYEPFIVSVFGAYQEVPMTGNEQKARFNMELKDKLNEHCTFETIQTMHQAFAERAAIHKEAKEPNPLVMMPAEIGGILRDAGAPKDAVSDFEDAIEPLCNQGADENGVQIENVTDDKGMVIETTGIKINVKPSAIYSVRAEQQNGKKVLIIDINDYCAINGLEVEI